MSDFKCSVIYDSKCTLCLRFKKALELIDHQKDVEFLPLYSPNVYLRYPQLSQEQCEKEVHLVSESGDILRGSDAVAYLVKILPGVSKFAWLINSESGKNVTNAFYKRINQMRMMQKRNCYTCGGDKKG